MNRETVITHLQIIHTWAEFARERDLQFFTAKHLEDIAQWSDDARTMLKEQETADTGSCRVFQCEKCGYGIDDIFVNDEEKYQIVPRYCPNCGRQVKLDEL